MKVYSKLMKNFGSLYCIKEHDDYINPVLKKKNLDSGLIGK